MEKSRGEVTFFRASAAMLSTAVSGFGNVLIQLAVAAVLDAESFGIFSLASTSILFCVGLGRALVATTDMIRGSAGHDSRPIAAAYVLAVGVAAIGLLMMGLSFFATWTFIRTLSWALLASTVFILQDCLRFRSFRLGLPEVALVSDILVLLCVGVGLITVTGQDVGFLTLVALWTAATGVGFVAVFWRVKFWPSLRGGASWLFRERDLSGPSSGEFLLQSGLPYGVNWVLALTSGLVDVAGYRMIQLIFSVVSNLAQGINAYALPRMVDSHDRRFVARSGLVQTSIILALECAVVIVILTLPGEVASGVFGSSWAAMLPFLLPGGLHGLFNALAIPIYSQIRIIGRARASFVVRVFTTLASLAAVAATVGRYGAVGVASSMALVAVLAYGVRAFIVYRVLLRG